MFDVVVQNADRKGDQILALGDQHRYGVDHELTFHSNELAGNDRVHRQRAQNGEGEEEPEDAALHRMGTKPKWIRALGLFSFNLCKSALIPSLKCG